MTPEENRKWVHERAKELSLKDLFSDVPLMIDLAKRGKGDDEVERDVEEIIKDTLNEPRSDIIFTPEFGCLMPGDVHESDTYRSVKELISELDNGGADFSVEIFDEIEHVLWEYQHVVQQGIREKIASHHSVSWYLTADDPRERALISYQDGTRGEWAHGCYADEVPVWLLIGLFRRIQQQKPLGDQQTDEAIKAVDELDAAYVQRKDRLDIERNLAGIDFDGEDDE